MLFITLSGLNATASCRKEQIAMPTNLDNFNTSQDALTVFFNEQPEQNMTESWISSLFEDGQYLYFDRGEFSGNGKELFKYLQKQIRDGEALMPDSQRMLMCYYMPIEELTEEWVDTYFERAREMRKYVQVANPFDQHYMLCFSLRVNMLDEEDFDRIAAQLLRLGTQDRMISQQIYLLRVSGFQEFTSQEHAMVQLLHLLSRQDYHKIQAQRYATAIRMFDYLDYYEDRARNCSEMLAKLSAWDSGANDPDLSGAISSIKMNLQPAVVLLREAGRTFRRKSQLYPVSINDFEGNKFKGYRCKITANHPKLQKRREEFTERRRRELAESIDFNAIRKMIKEEYHLPDLVEMKSRLDNGTLRKSILESVFEAQNEPEIQALVEEVCREYEKIAQEMTQDIPALRRKKQNDKKRYQKELQMAGRYQSLEDCFSRINEDIKPGPIRGRFSDNINYVTLISGRCLDEWRTRQYTITGEGVAYRYPAIRPCEIVELVEYDVLNIDDPNAAEDIKLLF